MHHLYYLVAIPATGLAIMGYVALYCANNSQGRMRTTGKLLAGWAFLLAVLIVIVAVIHPAMGERRLGPEGHFGRMGENPIIEPAPPSPEMAPAPTDAPPPADAPPMSAPEPQTSNPTGWKTE
jgi:hypothetical protein